MLPQIRRLFRRAETLPFFRRIALASAFVIASLPASVAAVEEEDLDAFRDSRQFRRVSFAVHAGFDRWMLSSLESTLDRRAESFSADGFNLEGADFKTSSTFGTEFQVRWNDLWFLRSSIDWTRTRADVRDRQTLSTLGGRRAVSLTFESRVRTDPFLFSFGVGRVFRFRSLRLGVSAGGVLAPVSLEEDYEIVLDTISKASTSASGVGAGLETVVALDYFTDARMNLVVELFGRLGSTTVNLDVEEREGTNVPGERGVDFSGIGLRLGVRWI